jgi:acyl-CoA synthetase (AMP-forming)/AMP-acid ligase II
VSQAVSAHRAGRDSAPAHPGSAHARPSVRDVIGGMLAAGARRTPDRVLFAKRGERGRTYREVDERASRLANGMLGSGLSRGDRVCVWADDSVEYLETYMAAARAGLVMVPINARLTTTEASVLLADAEPRGLIFSDRLAPSVETLIGAADLPFVGSYGKELTRGATGIEALIAASSAAAPPPPDEDDLFIIAYTSGTTGVPKGAMLTHRSVKATGRMNAQSYRLPLGSVGAYTGSMSFVGTVCAFAISHLYVGGTVHLLGKWDPAAALDLVAEQRANWIYVPSPAMADIGDGLRERPDVLEMLTSVFHSASKVSAARTAAFVDVVGTRYVEGWGMTETSGGIVTATTVADYADPSAADDLFDSAGRATVDVEIEILDAEGAALPHDGRSEGELVVRAANMMSGYWKRPDESAAALRDGWYRSGDIGRIDAAGYVYVSERRTDMISSGGMNVYPREVEDTILQIAGVRECAVVGAPHERWGQTVVAVVVADSGTTTESVIAHCRDRLAGYKKPTRVIFVESLPKTVSDKVRRAEVRAQVAAGTLGAA